MEDLIFNALLTAITICILIITLLWFMPHLIITIFVRVAVIFSEFKEKNVCVEGNIYCSYIERGNIDSTKKSILFIHGLFGSAVDFVQIAPYFDKSYHLVAIDMYNHGGTTSLNRNVTMEDMVVLVKMFSEKTDLHRRKFHLMGFSMGGSVAVDYASQYSEDVASLTLMGTAGMQVNYMSGKKPESVVFTSDEDLLNMLDYLSSGKLSHPPKAITTALRYYKKRKAPDVDYVLNGTVNDYKFSEAKLKSISHLDVLILWGDEDLICPKQGMDFLKSRLPRATDVLIKNCGHVMLLSHIKEVVITDLFIISEILEDKQIIFSDTIKRHECFQKQTENRKQQAGRGRERLKQYKMVAKALIMFFCSMVLFQTFQTSDAFLASFNGRRAAVEKENIKRDIVDFCEAALTKCEMVLSGKFNYPARRK